MSHSSGAYFGDLDCQISCVHTAHALSAPEEVEVTWYRQTRCNKTDSTMHLFVEFYKKYMSKIKICIRMQRNWSVSLTKQVRMPDRVKMDRFRLSEGWYSEILI